MYLKIIDKIKHKIQWWLTFKNDLGFNKNAWIDQRDTIIMGDKLSLGDNVYIGPRATILCEHNKVEIKEHVLVGPGLTIVENNHEFKIIGKYIRESGYSTSSDSKITIEKDCWIGANVTILSGVTIGRGSVIGACACVTKSIPPYSIAVGIPAKVVGKRFGNDDINNHELILSSNENDIICNS